MLTEGRNERIWEKRGQELPGRKRGSLAAALSLLRKGCPGGGCHREEGGLHLRPDQVHSHKGQPEMPPSDPKPRCSLAGPEVEEEGDMIRSSQTPWAAG